MSQAAGTAATTAATARDASAALPTAGTVRPAPADDGEKPFGALEKRQRTDGDTCGTTTTAAVGHPASPAVTTAAAAAVLAAKVGAAAGSVAASISPVTAAAATFLASTSASASTITNASSDIAVGYVPPTSSFSAAPSVTYTTSKPFGDSTLDGESNYTLFFLFICVWGVLLCIIFLIFHFFLPPLFFTNLLYTP